ncbi:DRMBL-domain-containing protein [Nadsonia fulvescens var. elongata DSM 6958]|uniref:DRMBL-domain-containing protein n=1 Tax=Nadsonia fulvescens var. elongata DSM 6958 TaxID=857566 RepID=A0A1E3PLD8_9ASCO|nr:DRMBL-domain-containing protein [Nadsonia fulvescens var. elongata DSM 6958]
MAGFMSSIGLTSPSTPVAKDPLRNFSTKKSKNKKPEPGANNASILDFMTPGSSNKSPSSSVSSSFSTQSSQWVSPPQEALESTSVEAEVYCPLCPRDLKDLSLEGRIHHVENCLMEPDSLISLPSPSPSMVVQPISAQSVIKRVKSFTGPATPSRSSSVKRAKRTKKSPTTSTTTLSVEEELIERSYVSKSVPPSFKLLRMGAVSIAVDAFKYGYVPGVDHYFLSHFHSDHYIGLRKAWCHGYIYCSVTTAKLCRMRLGVLPQWLRPLPMNQIIEIAHETTDTQNDTKGGNYRVLLIDANHCPGAVVFMYQNSLNEVMVHTGDFRACAKHIQQISTALGDHNFYLPVKTVENHAYSIKIKLEPGSIEEWEQAIKPECGDQEEYKLKCEADEQERFRVKSEYTDAFIADSKVELPTYTPISHLACNSGSMPIELRKEIDYLYLDNTYLDESYAFPRQAHVIETCAQFCLEFDQLADFQSVNKSNQSMIDKFCVKLKSPFGLTSNEAPRKLSTLFLVGTYSIGKERLAYGIARKLNTTLYAERPKYRVMETYESDDVAELLSDDPEESKVHLVSLRHVKVDILREYQKKYKHRFNRIVAFVPTGWTHDKKSQQIDNETDEASISEDPSFYIPDFTMEQLKRQVRGAGYSDIQIFRVPYSEHSSFVELRAFVLSLPIKQVIITVPSGRLERNQTFQQYLENWKEEQEVKGLENVFEKYHI